MDICTKTAEGFVIRQRIAEENGEKVKEWLKNKNTNLNIQKPIEIDAQRGIRPLDAPGNKNSPILFFQGTTNQAVNYFNNLGLKCAVLNFANSHHVGGGYLHGSMAQEEELCRTILDLFGSLAMLANKKLVYNDFDWKKHIKYSPDLNLWRKDCAESKGDYTMLSSPVKVSVITLAAPNLRSDNGEINNFRKNPKLYFEYIKNIIRNSCLAPIHAGREKKETNNVNVLVLGALGCGAFHPSPELENAVFTDDLRKEKFNGKKITKYKQAIANLFLQVLLEEPHILTVYDFISFAIPPGENYDEFYNVFMNEQLIRNRIILPNQNQGPVPNAVPKAVPKAVPNAVPNANSYLGPRDENNFDSFRNDIEKNKQLMLTELSNCEKESHYIWFLFPQLEIWSKRPISKHFGIKSLNEAKAFLNDLSLKTFLIYVTKKVKSCVETKNKTLHQIFGDDDSKFLSSMTLFEYASRGDSSHDLFLACRIIAETELGRVDNKTINFCEAELKK